MNERHPTVKFVVFALACLVAAGWIISVIGNVRLFTDDVGYQAVFSDVQGLVVNDAVKVAGVPVGKVTGIGVDQGRALVDFTVRDDVDLGRDTEVVVRWRNTIGLRYLYVAPAGDGELPPGHRFDEEHTRSPVDLNSMLSRITPVMRALDPEVTNVIVRELNSALEGREQEVQQLVVDAADLFETLAAKDAEAGRVLENGAALMDAYGQRREQLDQLIARFADVSEAVAARNDVLVDTVDDLTGAEDELARLLSTNRDQIDGLLGQLDAVSGVLADNHANIEKIFTWTGAGIVNYHRISRWGQWFNIRVPGLSEGEETISTERGASMPPRQGGGSGGSTSGAALHDDPHEPWSIVFGGAFQPVASGGGER